MQDVNSEILKLKALINNKQSTSVFANKANDCNQLVHDGYKLYVNDMTKKFTFTTANTLNPITVDTRTRTLGGVEYIDNLKISDIKTFKQQLDAEVDARIAGDEALDEAKADKEHAHGISDVSGLQTALDKKSDKDHTHSTFTDITVNTINGCSINDLTNSDNNLVPVPCIPTIRTDGCMEVGRYIDMHTTYNTANDYAVRLEADSGSLVIGSTTATNTFINPLQIFNSNLDSGHEANILVGKAYAPRQSGYIGFCYHVSDPYMSIGMHSEDTLLNVYKNRVESKNNITAPNLKSDNETRLASCETVITTKADKEHAHGISDVSGLQTALDNKSDVSHTHSSFTDVTVDTLNGARINTTSYSTSLGTLPVIPMIKADGVIEIGKYLDFHDTNATGSDYSVRVQANQNTLVIPNANISLTQSTARSDQTIQFTNNSDYARIRFYNYDGVREHGALEIATADDQTEPIYVRQYKYNSATWNQIGREACLLDASGNTQFPGTITASNVTATNETRLASCENLISTKADDSMLTALAARVAIVETNKADANHTHDDRYVKNSDIIATGTSTNESVVFISSASTNYLATCSGATAKITVQPTFYASLSNIGLYIHILYFEQRETYYYEYDIANGQVVYDLPRLNHFGITVSHNANVFTFTMHCDVDITDLNFFSVFMYEDSVEKELRFKYSRETTHPNVLNTNSDVVETILAHHDSAYVKNNDLITQRPSTLDRITKTTQTTNSAYDENDFEDTRPWDRYSISPDRAYDNYFAPITYTTTESNAAGTIHFQVSTPDVWPEWVVCWRGWHCSLNIQLGSENYKSTVDFYDGVNDVLGFYNATTSGSITGYNFSITWHYNNPDCSVDFIINSTNNSEIFDYFTIDLRIWDDYQNYYYNHGISGYHLVSARDPDATGDPETHAGCTFVYRYNKEYVYEDALNANTALGSIIINGILERIYPIGSIYASKVNTNPAIALGFGTWTAFETSDTIYAWYRTQ